MQRISIEQVTVGMIIGRDIIGNDGTVLMSEGMEINAAALRRFILSGITHIIVTDKPVADAGMGYNVSKRIEALPHLFRKYENDPFMTTLHNMLYNHFVERL